MKKTLPLLALVFTSPLFAQELPDACVQSMQNVYKFYYHEVLPKDENKLSSEEAKEMETVIGQLRASCPPELIAKMNHFLREDTRQG